MAWKKITKAVSAAQIHAHLDARPGVHGRTPGRPSISFSPWELFGAAARCSHLHHIDPRAVTPEAILMRLTFERHIDDITQAFELLPSAKKLKDYVANYFTGTLGAALAYLYLVQDGYDWIDHAENLKKAKGPMGDFVLARDDHPGLAMLEATASRQAIKRKFDNKVADKYTLQIEPHLTQVFGNDVVTHGYAIGAWMPHRQPASFIIHHTAAVSAGSAGRDGRPVDDLPDPHDLVQKGNYETAFRLAFGIRAGDSIRRGEIDDSLLSTFVQFDWLDRTWLTYDRFLVNEYLDVSNVDAELTYPARKWLRFALEKEIVASVLRGIQNRREGRYRFNVEPMSFDLRAQARGEDGAVFPDGLAVLSNKFALLHMRWCRWNLEKASFDETGP